MDKFFAPIATSAPERSGRRDAAIFGDCREQRGDEHFCEPLFVLFGGPSPDTDRKSVQLRIDQHGEAVGGFVSGKALSQMAASEEMAGELFHPALPLS